MPLVTEFAQTHKLPSAYIDTAETFFLPLCEQLAQQAQTSDSPLVIGIHGCQGSGKSTLTELLLFLLTRRYGIEAVGMSIDDFYLTRAERQLLATAVHPLLQTRGVPGTHDIGLLNATIDGLVNFTGPLAVPRFNKAIDDRVPETQWTKVNRPPKIILLEGWCVGALPQSDAALQSALNDLEQQEDASGSWRAYVNLQLTDAYRKVFGRLNKLIMLRAPGFHTVHQWRLEQEQRLVVALGDGADISRVMDAAAIARFIQHYQRVTEHALVVLPAQADVVFQLDESRAIVSQSGLEN